MDNVRRRVLAWLRIPLEPHVPPGEASSCEVFRAGRGFLTYRLIGWGLGQLLSLAGIVIAIVVLSRLPATIFRNERGLEPLGKIVLAVEILSIAFFLGQLVFTYWVVRWDYDCRYYVLTDRCLRIQEGILSFKEQTFTAANIQDIDVRQNPIQRALGIADVVVSTAGGGGGHQGPGEHAGASMHIGYLRGVARAAEIRDRLLARLKAYRDGGLGDEPSPLASAPDGSSDALRDALRELAREARSLREALSREA